jgi:hypothetical protein
MKHPHIHYSHKRTVHEIISSFIKLRIFHKDIFFFLWRYSPNSGLGLPPWNSPFHFSLLDVRQSVGLLGRVISWSQGLCLYTNTEKHAHTQTSKVHAVSGIQTHDPGFRASEDSARLRPLSYRDRLQGHLGLGKYKIIEIRSICKMSPIVARIIKECPAKVHYSVHKSPPLVSYPKTDESTPHLPILFLKDSF